jgi:hypothetical protein
MESHASMVQPSSAGNEDAFWDEMNAKIDRNERAAVVNERIRKEQEYQRCMDMLGDVPGDTLEDRIERLISTHLDLLGRAQPQTASESQASCNHWPGQARCGVCGMGYRPEERRT